MTLFCVRGLWWAAWVVGAAVWASQAMAQGTASAVLPASAQAVLTEMALHAAIIFCGEVVMVARADAGGYVDVKFRVDQPVKGVQKNGAYVLREWAGLWTGGVERYRVGQKYLMLLTARGSSGMSAPVGGMDGAIPLVAAGDSPLFKGNGDAPEDKAMDAPEAQVDLRWLAAQAARTASGGGSPVRTAAVKAPEAKTGGVAARAAGKMAGTLDLEDNSGASSGAILGAGDGGRPIASPILGAGDGDEVAWAGAVAPLPSVGSSQVAGGTYPVATKLSSVLALLSSGSGSTAHVSR